MMIFNEAQYGSGGTPQYLFCGGVCLFSCLKKIKCLARTGYYTRRKKSRYVYLHYETAVRKHTKFGKYQKFFSNL